MSLMFRGRRTPVTHSASLLATAVIVALLSPLSVRAQAQAPDDAEPVAYTKASGARVASAMRATAVPTIDGKLDEKAWEASSPITDFVQHEPSEGAQPSEATDVRILYDD